MPLSVVKTNKDEAKWKKAEEIAAKAGQEGNYAYIMGIYKKMKPDYKFKKTASYREGGSFTHDGKKYNLDKAFEIADNKRVRNMSVSRLAWVLNHDKPNKKRVSSADISAPLLVASDKKGRPTVIDGLHRLAKANAAGASKLPIRYLSKSDMRSLMKTASKVLIGKPPTEKERIEELKQISEQRKKYVPNKEVDEKLDRVTILFSELLDIDNAEVKKEVDSIAPIIMFHKKYFDIERPHKLAEKHNIPFDHDYDTLTSAHTDSYPSGHACQGHYLALIYSDSFPDMADKLMAISKDVAKARIDRGVHFPSDIQAGIALAEQIYKVRDEPKSKEKTAYAVRDLEVQAEDVYLLRSASDSFSKELSKIAESRIKGIYSSITNDPAGAESFGAMAGLSGAEWGRRALGKKTKVTIGGNSPVVIFHTDPLRGSGHQSQGEALAKALKDSGRSVKLVNIDKTYGKQFDKLNQGYKQFLEGKISKTNYAINYHIPFYRNLDWKKFKADTAGKQVVNMHAGIDLYLQNHVNKPMFTVHTDQAPFKTPGLKVQSHMPSQHIATTSAADILVKENPNLRGRVHKVDALPISPPTVGVADKAKFLQNKGKFNIVASGGGLGLGVPNQVDLILNSKNLPKGTVIHAVGAKSVMKNSGFYNEQAVKQLEYLKQKAVTQGVKVKVYEFAPLNYMMNNSEFSILRPGGTSITEARATGKPFRVFNESPASSSSISGRNVKAIQQIYKPEILADKPIDFNKVLKERRLFLSKKPPIDGGAKQMAQVINKTRKISYPKNISTISRIAKRGIGGIAIAAATASLYQSGILRR